MSDNKPRKTLRSEVLEFATIMEKKLAEHDDRPGWKHCTPEWLLDRLLEEVMELRWSVLGNGEDDIPREAADVANFAMMLADVCGGLPESARTRALIEIGGKDD